MCDLVSFSTQISKWDLLSADNWDFDLNPIFNVFFIFGCNTLLTFFEKLPPDASFKIQAIFYNGVIFLFPESFSLFLLLRQIFPLSLFIFDVVFFLPCFCCIFPFSFLFVFFFPLVYWQVDFGRAFSFHLLARQYVQTEMKFRREFFELTPGKKLSIDCWNNRHLIDG